MESVGSVRGGRAAGPGIGHCENHGPETKDHRPRRQNHRRMENGNRIEDENENEEDSEEEKWAVFHIS